VALFSALVYQGDLEVYKKQKTLEYFLTHLFIERIALLIFIFASSRAVFKGLS
jgi:hypothetical protein